jgi:phage protein D/phage baseplate assembly protein gpV
MPDTVDTRTQTSQLQIRLSGQAFAQDVLSDVADITIQQDSILPDAFTLRLHDINADPGYQAFFRLADSDMFAVGKEMQIAMGREDLPEPIMTGEITSIELEARADGLPMLTVSGYSKSHRLHRQKQTRGFRQMKISDAIRKVASESGLRATVEDTKVVYQQLVQGNQTNWEFVQAMAHRIGMEAFVRGDDLKFRTPAGTGGPIRLDFGSTLRHVRVRMSATRQVSSVEVRGWDPGRKTAVVGTAQAPNSVHPKDRGKSGGAVANVFGKGKYVLTDGATRTRAEATQRAQSVLDEIASGFVQLECTCVGSSDLVPGRQVKITGVSSRFNGAFYVTSATHRYTPDGGYLTTVLVTGRQASSLLAVVAGAGTNSAAPTAARPSAPQAGVVIGIVTNNKDPDMGGRVRLKFPWLDDAYESDWARMATPMAGPSRGFCWLPEVDDEVLVAFEHGDINHPYVIGAVWNGRDKPPRTSGEMVGADGKVNLRVIHSRSGHTVTIDDTQGSENISIVDKTGKNSIKLHSPSNTLTVAVDGNMVFQASRGNIAVKAKSVTIQATDDLKMDGRSITTQATQALTLKGLTTDVQATASMKVKGATTDVEASAKLGLNGGALTEVKGALIKLN